MPNVMESIEKYENSIKDAYEEQLDITKDVEEQITEMYEKQVEDRIDAIKKETDTIVSELEKQKKAYQDMRDEVDYQNEYDDKVDEIAKLILNKFFLLSGFFFCGFPMNFFHRKSIFHLFSFSISIGNLCFHRISSFL